ncbi:arylsulfatase B [Bombyx mori]|uniref:Sulfatase N-terminal domain-containing protein n=1 Tax=Bombyx mori TaxID=7091 RepID=A0A8R2AJ82_BOMMO|nr:arylsulfatase B [Bombyx mori]
MYNTILFLILNWIVNASTQQKSPNIVLIIADDLGWDDVSFHGSDQILTPNIDLLAYSGKALGRYYTHCICTPSRAALLTGKYAHRIGMQGYPLTNSEDRGLPTTEKILPQYLKELGYSTHLVGKWHVGQSRTEYLPMQRGFDSHFGHRGGYVDYYEYTLDETWSTGEVTGFGLFRNETPAWDVEGYLTDVYTEEAKSVIKLHDVNKPLFLMLAHNAPHAANYPSIVQAPPEDIRSMKHVELTGRRTYAAMVKKLDESVGEIVEALYKKQMLENTVIVFIADNGGMTSGVAMNFASNWPLRGLKMSPFEGGVRATGLVWSSSFNNSNHLWNGFIHVTDWLPIFLRIAGSEVPLDINGVDLWDDINTKDNSRRDEIYEIDDYTGFAAIISQDFKLVSGQVTLEYSNYQGENLRGMIGDPPSYADSVQKSKTYRILKNIGKPFKKEDVNLRRNIRVKCNQEIDKICYPDKNKFCLYNIKEDPCETNDLSATYPDIAESMLKRLHIEISKTIPRTVPLYRNPESLPRLHNFTWTTFADNFK